MLNIMWIIIAFEALVGILLLMLRLSHSAKDRTFSFVVKLLSNKWILHYLAPFWGTIVISIIISISLMYSGFNPAIQIIINMFCTISTFYLGIATQSWFMQVLFSHAFTKAMNEISNEYFILRFFII